MSYDVTVVGSGFSAISTVINLLQLLPCETSIAVVGDEAGFGRGTAYRTELHLHRLNVPAARMSAFVHSPDDFLNWLKSKGRPVVGASFVSRNDYGLYLRDTLASLLRGREQRARVDFIKAKVLSCDVHEENGILFRLNDGRSVQASNVVLCLGVGTASLPRLTPESDRSLLRRVVRNPWRLGWLSKVLPDDRVCILGSGLTMVDQVLALRDAGHRGRIDVLSRRGLVPHAHHAIPAAPVVPAIDEGRSEISEILSDLRQQVRAGADWLAVMDGLRPQTQKLWQSLSVEQRSRFLRHALAWWNIHRHRVAPQVHEIFSRLISERVINVHAGFVAKITRAGEENVLTFRRRGSDVIEDIEFDWLVNCTGMERAGIGHSPLLQDMHGKGLIEMDALGLGIRVDQQSRAVTHNPTPVPEIYVVGALTAGQFWEITAVPDIRVQTHRVAEAVAEKISEKRR